MISKRQVLALPVAVQPIVAAKRWTICCGIIYHHCPLEQRTNSITQKRNSSRSLRSCFSRDESKARQKPWNVHNVRSYMYLMLLWKPCEYLSCREGFTILRWAGVQKACCVAGFQEPTQMLEESAASGWGETNRIWQAIIFIWKPRSRNCRMMISAQGVSLYTCRETVL